MSIVILGIESSCDDTSAAITSDNFLLSNVISNQDVHKSFGGVVPELASRAHQQNIIPVVDEAIKKATINKNDISAVAFTRMPGLLGSLLVGCSFAKSFSLGLGIPIIEVNHLQAHILSHFIQEREHLLAMPEFPFLCLLVSGGNTQIVLMHNQFNFEIIGTTIDDAAGEAFDKAAKILGLPYPGGPLLDKLSKEGNNMAFKFNEPNIGGYNYSFSGLKTSILYFIRDRMKERSDFIDANKADLCASIQYTIVKILLKKLEKAAMEYGINQIAIAGGVSANSYLRSQLTALGQKNNWKIFIPKFEYSTDNAAMIAITGYYKYLKREFATMDIAPLARV